MIRKLRQKVKVKDEDRVKLEEVSNHANEDFESKQHLNDNESKNLQSDIKEAELVENAVPIETILDEKEDIEVQIQCPITVLQKMRNAYLMMIKSLSRMQLGFVLSRNFTAMVMR